MKNTESSSSRHRYGSDNRPTGRHSNENRPHSGRLFDISPVEVLQWSLAQGEQAGWVGLGPAGGGASWGMVGTRNGVKVRVSFASGLGGGPPQHPERGYGVLVRVYK